MDVSHFPDSGRIEKYPSGVTVDVGSAAYLQRGFSENPSMATGHFPDSGRITGL
jgi:hypothetical protein